MNFFQCIQQKTDSSFLNRALDDYRKARQSLDALAEPEAGSSTIHPQYVTRLVSELADEDAIFSCDVGTPIAWTARYLKMNGKRRLVGSFNHGSMANSLLHSIGAQAAFRDRQVISMSGDGGFAMMMGEFLTLIQTGLPVKVVVLNNGTLGFVEMEMKASGFLDTGCDLKNPNFAAMANAIGIKGVRVEHPAELEGSAERSIRPSGSGSRRRGERTSGARDASCDLRLTRLTTLDCSCFVPSWTVEASNSSTSQRSICSGNAVHLIYFSAARWPVPG